MKTIISHLVGGFNLSEKWWSESQLGWWNSQLNGKIRFIIQTASQPHMKPDGGFHSHEGIPKNVFGWFHGKSESKMDDDWGYPHDKTETSIWRKFILHTLFLRSVLDSRGLNQANIPKNQLYALSSVSPQILIPTISKSKNRVPELDNQSEL